MTVSYCVLCVRSTTAELGQCSENTKQESLDNTQLTGVELKIQTTLPFLSLFVHVSLTWINKGLTKDVHAE